MGLRPHPRGEGRPQDPRHGIEPGILVNVNFPDCEPDEVQGIAVAAQGFRNQALLSIDARVDGRGNPYFWLAFAKARFEPGHGSDLKAIAEKRISVTPLRLDLTDEPTLTPLRPGLRGMTTARDEAGSIGDAAFVLALREKGLRDIAVLRRWSGCRAGPSPRRRTGSRRGGTSPCRCPAAPP